MDFAEFKSKKVWLTVPIDEDGEVVEFRIAYRPRALTDEDAEWLAQLDRARAIDYQGLYDEPDEPPVENRAQRRAKEHAQKREAATPERERRKAPTYVQYMERLIVDWDLTLGKDATGEPIPMPLTRDSFQDIDFAVRRVFVLTIMFDYLQRPNRLTSSVLSSEETTGSGPTMPNSSPNPSSMGAASSPGTSRDTRNGLLVPSGATGSGT